MVGQLPETFTVVDESLEETLLRFRGSVSNRQVGEFNAMSIDDRLELIFHMAGQAHTLIGQLCEVEEISTEEADAVQAKAEIDAKQKLN